MNKLSRLAVALLLAAVLTSPLTSAHAQGTAFTYQGRLNSTGVPANGLYDFRFRLYADPSGNTQVGNNYATNSVAVTNGLFMTTIDFGAGIFTGGTNWLEVDVRTNNPPSFSANYALLSPFQQVTPTPNAIFAETANNLSGPLPAAQISGAVPSANLSGTYGNVVTLNNPGNSFSGNGSGLTSLNAAALIGTVPNASLPASVVTNAETGVTLSGTFSGNGGGLTNLNAAQLTGTVAPAQLSALVVTNGASGVNLSGTFNGTIAATSLQLAPYVVLSSTNYSTNGLYLIVVPPSVSSMVVKLWGAAGGAGDYNNVAGGGGAFSQVTLNVTPGQTFWIQVGQGGSAFNGSGTYSAGGGGEAYDANGGYGYNYSASEGGGGGGQASSLFYLNLSTGLLVTKAVAGGGGGADSIAGRNGPVPGGPGQAAGSGIGYTAGATTTGLPVNTPVYGLGTDGDQNYLGGGGGGYGGGAQDMGGGSYGDNTVSGNGLVPGNNTDPFYVSGGGRGVPNGNGHDGLAVVLFTLPGVAGSGNATIYGNLNSVGTISASTIQSGGTVSAASFSGNGGGLTGLNAGQLGGSLPGGVGVPAANLTGALPAISGASLTSLNASQLSNGVVSWAVLPGFQSASNYIQVGGGQNNVVTPSADHAAIGGGFNNTIGANDYQGTIAGGYYNTLIAGAGYSAIGGGQFNTNSSNEGTIGGGQLNLASGQYQSTVGGGYNNVASGSYATVPGGFQNVASGVCSLAAGQNATDNGFKNAFVWGDGSRQSIAQGTNTFNVLATGGFWIFSGAYPAGVKLTPGSSAWATISDRNAKKNFAPVNTRAVLDKLSTIPIQQWNYKWEKDADVPNIGPMAQDFKHAFYPGRDDKSITTLEFDGVELAAIQGLNEKVDAGSQQAQNKLQKLEAENEELKSQNDALAERLNKLEAIVQQLSASK